MRPSSKSRPEPPQTTDSPDPLSRLRRRYIIGAVAAAAVFFAAFTTNLVRHGADDDALIIGVEVWATGLSMVCVFIAASTWITTRNTEYALSIWKVAARSAVENPPPDGSEPSVQRDATPINGRTTRDHLRDRIAG